MKHTGDNWQVVADPVNKGIHPYHDSRFVMTDDAEIEVGYNEFDTGWRLLKGSIICKMRDTENIRADALLISASPEMFRALQLIQGQLKAYTSFIDTSTPEGRELRASLKVMLKAASSAIDKAEGLS